jgi:hypothetical protein
VRAALQAPRRKKTAAKAKSEGLPKRAKAAKTKSRPKKAARSRKRR